jgi:DNA-binding MarR family transcriptional regulator/GNAT superfamily N-acetyltransferase
MPDPNADSRIETVRGFNRFYTRRIGVLQEGLLATPWSLTQSRLLWELAHREAVTGSELARELGLDPGYLSRLLRGFKDKGLIAAARDPDDARHLRLRITAKGRRAFAPLDTRSRAEVGALLDGLDDAGQRRLLEAMAQIEQLLGGAAQPRAEPWLLRSHRAGDIGWAIGRHGALYAQEYGWDLGFEALVAQIAGRFLERFDPTREACWIAERERANVGCVFLVQARDETSDAPLEGIAQLRLLLVEPSARGLGIGARLVDECERFARHAGYRRIVLWTNSVLVAARGIYAKAGYRLLRSEPHHSFGHDLVGEYWSRDL